MNWIDLHDDFPAQIPQRAIKPEPIIRNKYDWKIHKILGEAKKVYICPARGNGKPERTLRMYKELLEEGKEVVLVRSADIPKEKNDGWTPKVRFDSWVIDESLYFDQMLWDRLVLDKHFCNE